MRKILLAFFLLGAFFLSAAPLKIGVACPLTGNESFGGQSLKNGLLLAQKDLKAQGQEVALVFEDTATERPRVITAVKKILSVDKVDALITQWTFDTEVCAPLTDKAHIVHFNYCWDTSITQKYPYLFSNTVTFKKWSDDTLALVERRGYKRVAMMIVNDPGGLVASDYIKEQSLTRKTFDVVAYEKLDASLRDFRTTILKSQAAKPDAYLLILVYPASDIFLKELHELAPQVAVTGYLDHVQDKSLLEGITWVSEKRSVPTFDKKYATAYGTTDFHLIGLYGYDTLGILAQAWKISGEDRAALREAVLKTQNYAGLGGTLSCSDGGVFNPPTVIKTIKDGQKQILPTP